MPVQNKPTIEEVREFRNALTERGFSRESRYDDTKFYKEFGIVHLWVNVSMTKKGEFKNVDAFVRIMWSDYMPTRGLPNKLELGKKPVRSLDMGFIDRCEEVASGMNEEIHAMFDILKDMAKNMQVSHIENTNDTRPWITNGNADCDDRLDDAQSWGIFG